MSEERAGTGRPTLSWMVRCWKEPREKADEEPVLRIFVRDLKTGEERYLSDPHELGELILRRMREASRASKAERKNYKIG